jgi:hypothetical protein
MNGPVFNQGAGAQEVDPQTAAAVKSVGYFSISVLVWSWFHLGTWILWGR